jgi:hypothetical protein
LDSCLHHPANVCARCSWRGFGIVTCAKCSRTSDCVSAEMAPVAAGQTGWNHATGTCKFCN